MTTLIGVLAHSASWVLRGARWKGPWAVGPGSVRYRPADAGRFDAYSACLYDMTEKKGGREVFDVCMAAKGDTWQ